MGTEQLFRRIEKAMDQLGSGNSTVLVLDDDEDTRFAISRILKKCECAVLEAESVSTALTALEEANIDIVFSDMRIPGEDGGEELLAIAKDQYPDVHIVLMSCAMDDSMRSSLIENGATACLQKPFFKEACMQVLDFIQDPQRKTA